MWTTLRDQRQIDFYETAQRGAADEREDWRPMIRLIRTLQERGYANELFAFTSLLHFHVTTAQSYGAFEERTATVGITWVWSERVFHLRRHVGGWIADEPPAQICTEERVLDALEPMIAMHLNLPRPRA
jgi:hypothetical protein